MRALLSVEPGGPESLVLGEIELPALVRSLVALGRSDQAEQQYETGVRMLKEAGVASSGALLQD